MIEQDTIVRVIGFEDVVNNFADFDALCELNNSFKIALERWKEVFLKEKRSDYYTINVCYGIDCIYYIYYKSTRCEKTHGFNRGI